MPDLPEKDSGKIRILHTADWHLGREFHGRDMSRLHREFFSWLGEQIEERQIDLVLMAGDIYDRALPPVSAISLFNEEMARLSELAPFVLVTGNHDSTVRMGHGPLLKDGIHLRSGIGSMGEPIIFEKPFPLAVYPVPYLDPMTVASELGLDESTHRAVIGEAVRRSLDDLGQRPGTRSVAIGHAFITGAEPSESERSIQVGGAEDVSSSVFDGFDYVALGHLHRPQAVGDSARYSGSPVPLSYSEVGSGSPKSVVVLEIDAGGLTGVETVEVPQLVHMSRLKGDLEDLLEDEALEDRREDWLEVTLTDEVRPDQPMDRLRSRFENVVSLRFESTLADTTMTEAEELDRLARTDPAELVASFVADVRGTPPAEPEKELIREALDTRTGAETRS